MEEKDPAVAFLPDEVSPLCEDKDREMVLRLHSVMDERGLARLPPPPPPGGAVGSLVPGGSGCPGTKEGTPEPSHGGAMRPRSVSPILVDYPTASPSPLPAVRTAPAGGSSSTTATSGQAPAPKHPMVLSPRWRMRPMVGAMSASGGAVAGVAPAACHASLSTRRDATLVVLAADDAEVADMGASSPHAPVAGPQESTLLPESAAGEPVLTIRVGSSIAQPAPTALHRPAEEGAAGEAPCQEAAVQSPPTLAQVVVAMEAMVRDLRILQASGDLSDELASHRMAWERDLQTREEELHCRSDQVQLALIDAACHEEALATQEQRLQPELGATSSASRISLSASLSWRKASPHPAAGVRAPGVGVAALGE
ncbi:uncharacterized protein LOC120695223 [Panicum virgatum]|uniref:uncharacterized protein LOC120695223 n=1 Tax=Panicum virgatum TaxID=38727 RepID=UPI0019D67F9B|nr:uncharacterized protein LOC120695223 [Panicum virgatum]